MSYCFNSTRGHDVREVESKNEAWCFTFSFILCVLFCVDSFLWNGRYSIGENEQRVPRQGSQHERSEQTTDCLAARWPDGEWGKYVALQQENDADPFHYTPGIRSMSRPACKAGCTAASVNGQLHYHCSLPARWNVVRDLSWTLQ